MPFTLRPYRHFPVQWSVTYNAGPFQGQGTDWNLSCTGWRLSGDLPMRPGETLSLTVTLPDEQHIEVLERKGGVPSAIDQPATRTRHPDSIGQAFLWALLPTLVLFLSAPSISDAQVVTTSITSTAGAGNLGTTITHAGNLYNITGGTRPGNGPNLFHSFGDFSVGGGDIANFLNNTGLHTSNILGRVTGGNVSNIFGTIQTTDFGNAICI